MKRIFLPLCASLLAMPSAYALDGFYLGASYGQSDIDTGVTNLTGSASLDETDNAFKIYAGYQFNKYVAAEVHYADLGEATLSGNSGDGFTVDGTTYNFTANNVEVTQEAKTFGLSGKFTLPINKTVAPFAKLGLHRWDANANVATSAGYSEEFGDDGTDLFYGLGLDVSVTDNVKIRAEYERFDFDGDDVDYMSIGVAYRF